MDADEVLEQWLAAGQDLLKARKGSEREKALEARLEQLEARFKEKPADERQEALEEISDEEYDLIMQHRKGKEEPEPTPEPEPQPEPEPVAAKTRPGRKSGKVYPWTVDDSGNVMRVDIPIVYSGADEDDLVPLPTKEEAA